MHSTTISYLKNLLTVFCSSSLNSFNVCTKRLFFSPPPFLQNCYHVDLYSLGSYLLLLAKHRHFHLSNLPFQRYLLLVLCLCNYAEASAHKQNHIFFVYQTSPVYWSISLLTLVLFLFLLINNNVYFHILMLLTLNIVLFPLFYFYLASDFIHRCFSKECSWVWLNVPLYPQHVPQGRGNLCNIWHTCLPCLQRVSRLEQIPRGLVLCPWEPA